MPKHKFYFVISPTYESLLATPRDRIKSPIAFKSDIWQNERTLYRIFIITPWVARLQGVLIFWHRSIFSYLFWYSNAPWQCPKLIFFNKAEMISIYQKFVESLGRTPDLNNSPESGLAEKTIIDSIIDLVPQTNLFSITSSVIKESVETNYKEIEAALPFKTCWFQLIDDKTGKIGIQIKELPQEDGTPTTLLGLWIHEIRHQTFLSCLITMESLDGRLAMRKRYCVIDPGANYHNQALANQITNAIQIILYPLSKGYITSAVKKLTDRIKIKDPKSKEKKVHKIRHIVMIYPKDLNPSEKAKAEREGADFSHRFEVRAHWRRLFFIDGRLDENGNRMIDFSRIGKDRDGNYSVYGHTFILEQIRGPDKLPIIKKTRHAKEQVQNNSNGNTTSPEAIPPN